MNVLKKPNAVLRASLTRLRPARPGSPQAAAQAKNSLIFQRLFWGSLAGCLIAVFFGDSPLLENLELSMLDWRYTTADKLAPIAADEHSSRNISIVAFDDASQFDLGCPRFNENSAQATLAGILDTVEKGQPAVVAVDLDLRGAANGELLKVFQRYRNVILAVFGSLEGNSDLPDAAFMKHAIGYGYDELARESNGQVLRLPVNAPNQMGSEASGLAQVPSLTEAISAAYRQAKGLSPLSKQLQSVHADQPVFINFKNISYPTFPMSAVHEPGFDPAVFKDRIVLVAPTLTSKRLDSSHVITPLRGREPSVYAHADAVSTLLRNEAIFTYPGTMAHHILILLGAVFGAVCSILAAGKRAVFTVCGAGLLIVVAQFSFQNWQIALPVVGPLAVLLSGFILGTVIHLDTDLRLRNRELAAAREQMQVRAEEERKRIAEDLHDETLPALSAVARMIDELGKAEKPEATTVSDRMRNKIDTTIQDMRRVINDLHPSVLETMGFVPALENLACMTARDASLDYTFVDRNDQDDYEISDFAKLQLYRVVQEGLNNVAKHAQASRLEVKLQTHNGKLEISVTDDGRGINPKLIRKDSHGLLNIRHRAQLIGAAVEWRRPQAFMQGTEMRVSYPLHLDISGKGGALLDNAPPLPWDTRNGDTSEA